jgi:hypothetical protein
MASQNPNIFKRAYENLMGTPEQNKKAAEDMKNYPPEQKFQKMIGKGKKEEAETPAEEPVKKAKGGSVTMASRRGDGCAVRGKTKGGIK